MPTDNSKLKSRAKNLELASVAHTSYVLLYVIVLRYSTVDVEWQDPMAFFFVTGGEYLKKRREKGGKKGRKKGRKEKKKKKRRRKREKSCNARYRH